MEETAEQMRVRVANERPDKPGLDTGRPVGTGTNNANGAQLPPPVHVEPQPAPQPMHELIGRIDRAWGDIGALISRTDQLEATVRRLDRQTIMMVGTLAVVLYVTRKALMKVQELELGAD